jgi:uncharacterized protein (DUF1800 family)
MLWRGYECPYTNFMAGLTERQKIGHLLRRFGFGASVWEMAEFEPLGVKGTMDRLLDWNSAKDLGDPMQFAFKKDEDAEPGGYRFRLWWVLQMVTTEHPLREKLALFWHDHFAVNEEDVSHGLAMLDYLERIRANPAGKFGDILNSLVKSPAVMRQLNVEMISRATPNENFARELMELYTLGEGNGYSEKDIKEVAKAITGWSHHDVFYRMGNTQSERLRYMRKFDTPAVFYIVAPEVNIPGTKTVMGTAVETGDDVLKMLSHHPQTARYICGKLWSWFGYENPEPKVIDRLVKRFMDTDGDIKLVLREMSEMEEFYSAKSYRSLVKNPIDYIVGICRAQNAGPRLAKDLVADRPFDEPVAQSMIDSCGAVMYFMSECGMNIFFPDSVAGWEWHDGWTSTNMLLRRRQFTGVLTWYPVEEAGKETLYYPDEPIKNVINEIRKRDPQTVEALVNAFCMVYDCQLAPDQQQVLINHFDKHGGLNLIKDDRSFGWICTLALQLLGSVPEFQLC